MLIMGHHLQSGCGGLVAPHRVARGGRAAKDLRHSRDAASSKLERNFIVVAVLSALKIAPLKFIRDLVGWAISVFFSFNNVHSRATARAELGAELLLRRTVLRQFEGFDSFVKIPHFFDRSPISNKPFSNSFKKSHYTLLMTGVVVRWSPLSGRPSLTHSRGAL